MRNSERNRAWGMTMRKLITLALILLSPMVVAQEKQIWACQQVEGTLLDWEDGRWKMFGVSPMPLLLTIDGAYSSFKKGDIDVGLACNTTSMMTVSCLDNGQAYHLYFDPSTGKLGYSFLAGALQTGDQRDSVSASIYNCTKF